jgi:prepilin-type N-terminal cleavage/methylation domain-containing protein
MMRSERKKSAEAGFSLLELLLAMTVILIVMGAAFALAAGAFNVRKREDDRTAALSNARRALHQMTREIATAGFDLPRGQPLPLNGVVAAQSGQTAIRILSNHGGPSLTQPVDPAEDVLYRHVVDAANDRSYIMRHDYNGPAATRTTVLVDWVDSLRLRYFDRRVDYTPANCNVTVTTPGVTDSADITKAKYVVATICVNLPAVGTPGDTSYKPPTRVQLTSDVTLRNANISNF